MTAKKVRYVTSQLQTRQHTCHWPGCEQQVPPAMWGCRKHWSMLPSHIKTAIWGSYRPGQEQTGDPSYAYIKAAQEAQTWIRTHTHDKGEK